MSLQCGLVGLPNAGKSTLFNALTSLQVPAEKYPFCTVDPNVGVVNLEDSRLVEAAAAAGCTRITPAWIRFVDIAGLVEGASRGEGLGNRFLGHIREMDALIHVVRAFDVEDVAHPLGRTDPLKDIELVQAELLLADLETVERQMEKTGKRAKGGERADQEEQALLEEIRGSLLRGIPAPLRGGQAFNLLSCKPRLYVLNVDEEGLTAPWEEEACFAAREGAPLLVLAASLEEELTRPPPGERQELRQAYGMGEEVLTKLVGEAYRLLNMITFFTVKGEEAKAWTVKAGTRARQGAGKVHSDMEKGFIKAEVIGWQGLVEAGSLGRARETGMVRIEGRDYLLQDGDVVLFHFRV